MVYFFCVDFEVYVDDIIKNIIVNIGYVLVNNYNVQGSLDLVLCYDNEVILFQNGEF